MPLILTIFDLDGTLLDTSPGILESVRYAAEKLGYPLLSQEQIFSFIGPPLKDSFRRCYGCGEAEAAELTAAYREHYQAGALLHAKPYDGIFTMCESLRRESIILTVATSKPQVFSEQILRHFGFDRYFSILHGADLEGKLKKTDLIRLCANDVGVPESQCVMVGDTEHDAKGAAEAGIPFLGVRYGFGNQDEMARYPSIGMADTPCDALAILLRERETV